MAEKREYKRLERIERSAAAVVSGYDVLLAKADRLGLKTGYKIAENYHKFTELIYENRKQILAYAAACLMVLITVIAVHNRDMGYSYAYNGRVLGYVKNQADVTRILGLVSDELSQEYGSQITIDEDSDITFKRVSVVDKDIDDSDTVLKRMTYMSDMEAEVYGIYVDGKRIAIMESKEAANDVLKEIQQEYLKQEDKKRQYQSISFKEKVQIKKMQSKLAYVDSEKEALKALETGGQEDEVYTVKKGDTFSEICSDFDISFSELKDMNPDIKEDELHIGDKLTITKATSILTVVTVEKSTYAEKIKYKTKYKKTKSLYVGDKKTERSGHNGKRVVTAILTRENGEVVETQELTSEVIDKPISKIVLKGTKKRPKTAPTGTFIYPVSGYTLSSTFGYRWGALHEGIDLACSTGTTIVASDGGTVVYAGWFSGYGNMIEIDHGNGVHTRYGHCSAIDVTVGEKVYQGQKIGEVGNTGNSYGSHCHFEIRINGTPVNPLRYL